ncbi:MAG: hypothetical protein HYX66_09210 [Ignavibacteria bacterium]|nr:hypothetical protein [Ignavibacteria bacterium]
MNGPKWIFLLGTILIACELSYIKESQFPGNDIDWLRDFSPDRDTVSIIVLSANYCKPCVFDLVEAILKKDSALPFVPIYTTSINNWVGARLLSDQFHQSSKATFNVGYCKAYESSSVSLVDSLAAISKKKSPFIIQTVSNRINRVIPYDSLFNNDGEFKTGVL